MWDLLKIVFSDKQVTLFIIILLHFLFFVVFKSSIMHVGFHPSCARFIVFSVLFKLVPRSFQT